MPLPDEALASVLLAAQQLERHDAAAIRDTIASVFRGAEYARSAQRTLGGVLWDLLERTLRSIFALFNGSDVLRRAALGVGFALIALIAARFVYVAYQRGQFVARARATRPNGAAAPADWSAAQRAAADGRYTEAAHLLYAALLHAVARRERLRLHPSKTAGDYVRDLRARSSGAFTPFRQFVRAFEFIIYGRGECDRAQFDDLSKLAEPLMRSAE